MTKIVIKVGGPFNVEYTRRYYSRITGEIVDRFEGEIYKRVLRTGDRDVLVSVRSLGEIGNPKLEVTGTDLRSEEAEILRQKLRRIFNLEIDLDEFYRFSAEDDLLFSVFKELYGYRPPCFPTLFESLICTVIGQQINVRFALDVKSRLVRQYGRTVYNDGKEYYGFPSPKSLASVSAGDLRGLKISKQKSRYIAGVAELFEEGEVDEEEILKLDDEETLNCLMKIKGVGRWSAENIMMRGLGRVGVIPAAGTGIRAALAHFFDLEKATEEEVRNLSERWGKYKGLTAFYLRSAYYH